MTDDFPIDIPAQLPIRINPCPIVEAIFEVRFSAKESWATIPGLLYNHIRGRFHEQKQLPLAQVPEDLRRQDPGMAYLPLMQFISPDFLIQLGPQVVGLATKPKNYPGWTVIRNELEWLLACLKEGGFIQEVERLSARYIDFFHEDIFSNLKLSVQAGDRPITGGQTDLTTVLRRDPIVIRLHVTNGAVAALTSRTTRCSGPSTAAMRPCMATAKPPSMLRKPKPSPPACATSSVPTSPPPSAGGNPPIDRARSNERPPQPTVWPRRT